MAPVLPLATLILWLFLLLKSKSPTGSALREIDIDTSLDYNHSTPDEQDLEESMEAAMRKWPAAYVSFWS